MEIIKNLIVRGYIDKRASLVLEDESFSKIVIITYGSMKRDLVSNEGNGKRLRAEAARPTFLELPNDILQIILSKITAADIVNLGTVSKSFRQELKPFVFDKLQTSWYDLINEEKPPSFCLELSRQIRIVDFYSYGEWQLDIFKLMRSKFPRLTHLLLNSANSSNWLKYRTSDSIRELTLYYEKGHNETQDRQHEPNPKNIRKLSTIVSGSPKVFSLTHLHDFKNLLKLLLDGYHFNWSDEDAVSCPSLTSLTLINCTWEYPFTLAQFSHGGNLSYIALTYNQNHPFILLERFNKFLETPSLGIGASAEYLRLSFEDYSDSTWRKLFLAKQLDKFSATEFPRLRELELYGIQMNLENYKQYVNLIQNNFNLHSLKLSIWEILKEDPPSERCTQREITRGERYVNLFKNLLQERVNIKVGIRLI